MTHQLEAEMNQAAASAGASAAVAAAAAHAAAACHDYDEHRGALDHEVLEFASDPEEASAVVAAAAGSSIDECSGGESSSSVRSQNESLDKEGKTCPLCHMQFKRRTGLDRHTLKHYCRVCGELFCQGQQRESHHRAVHPSHPQQRDDDEKAPTKNFGKLKCPECRRTYNYIKQLEKHRASVHNRFEVIRRYVHNCSHEKCRKSFVSKDFKNKHELEVHGISPIQRSPSPVDPHNGSPSLPFITASCSSSSHAANSHSNTGCCSPSSLTPHAPSHGGGGAGVNGLSVSRAASPLAHQMVNPELSTPTMLGGGGGTSPVAGTVASYKPTISGEVYRGPISPISAAAAANSSSSVASFAASHSHSHVNAASAFHSTRSSPVGAAAADQMMRPHGQSHAQCHRHSSVPVASSPSCGQSRPLTSSDSCGLSHPLAGLNANALLTGTQGGMHGSSSPTPATVLTGTVSPTGSTCSNNSHGCATDADLVQQITQLATSSPSSHSTSSRALTVSPKGSYGIGGGGGFGGNTNTAPGASNPYDARHALSIIQQIKHHQQLAQQHQQAAQVQQAQAAQAAAAVASSPLVFQALAASHNQDPSTDTDNILAKLLLEKQQIDEKIAQSLHERNQREKDQQQFIQQQLLQQQQQTALLTSSVTMPVPPANNVPMSMSSPSTIMQPTPRSTTDQQAMAALLRMGNRTPTPTPTPAMSHMQSRPDFLHFLKNGASSPNVPMASPSPSMSQGSPMEFAKYSHSPQPSNFQLPQFSADTHFATMAAQAAALSAAQNQRNAMQFQTNGSAAPNMLAFNNLLNQSRLMKPESSHVFQHPQATPLMSAVKSKPAPTPPLKPSIGVKRGRDPSPTPGSTGFGAVSVQKVMPVVSPEMGHGNHGIGGGRSGRAKMMKPAPHHGVPSRGDSNSASPSRGFNPVTQGLQGGDRRQPTLSPDGTGASMSPFRTGSDKNVIFGSTSRSRSPEAERIRSTFDDTVTANNPSNTDYFSGGGGIDRGTLAGLYGGGLDGGLGMRLCAAKTTDTSAKEVKGEEGGGDAASSGDEGQPTRKKPRVANPLAVFATTAIALGRHNPSTASHQASATAPPTSASSSLLVAAEASAIARRVAQHRASALASSSSSSSKPIEIRVGAKRKDPSSSGSSSSSSRSSSTSPPTQEHLSSRKAVSMSHKDHPLQKFLSFVHPPKPSHSQSSSSSSSSQPRRLRSRSPSSSACRLVPVSANATSSSAAVVTQAEHLPAAFSRAALAPEDLAAMRPPPMSDVPSSAAPSDVGGASCHSGEERLNSVMSHIHQQDDTSAPASPPSPSSFSQQSPGACGPAVASRPSVSSARHDQSDDNKDDTDSSDKDKEEDVMDMRVNEDWTAEEVRDFARRRWPQLKGFADQCYENFVNGRMFLRLDGEMLTLLGVSESDQVGLQKDVLFYMNNMLEEETASQSSL